jgi:hypothetical protein
VDPHAENAAGFILAYMVDGISAFKVAESEIAAKQTLHESRNRVSYAASQTVFARRFS